MGTRGSFLGIKRPGKEADHSPPLNAEAKNGGAIPSLPVRLLGVALKHRDKFTLSYGDNENLLRGNIKTRIKTLSNVNKSECNYEPVCLVTRTHDNIMPTNSSKLWKLSNNYKQSERSSITFTNKLRTD
jgi:hypothetical protein